VKSKQSKKWFVKVRGSYLPRSWQGWLLYIPYVLYLCLALETAWHGSANLLTKLFNLLVYWVVGVVIMTWIATKKS
jgi:hypothetical protein